MKLHEAIDEILKRNGKPMTAPEIAAEINKAHLYTRGDEKPLPSSQIGARVKNYPQWFDRRGSYISRKGYAPSSSAALKASHKPLEQSKNALSIEDYTLAEKVLMNEKNFKSAATIDSLVPDQPGLYALRIKDIKNLPSTFSKELALRKHNLIYIGIASKSLLKRMVRQELRAKGHGTFFRSMGALLGHLPPKGSLNNKSNKRNYTFSIADESKIIEWMNNNLLVNWIVKKENLEPFETQLILKHNPLINIAKNPLAIQELKALRAKCVEVANQK